MSFTAGPRLSPFVGQSLRMVARGRDAAGPAVLTELIEPARSLPSSTRPIPERVPDALRCLDTGQARGKLVITV